MRSILPMIWRAALRPVLAHVLASAVTALILVVIALVLEPDNRDWQSTLGLWVLVCVGIAALAGVPALVIVWTARRFQWRRPLSEMLAGLVLAPLLYLLLQWQPNPTWDTLASVARNLIWLTMPVPGAIGGLVYWLLAGRPGPKSPALLD